MNRRRTYYGDNNENFTIIISKTESSPSSMVTVEGDPEPFLKKFRRCLARKTGDKKVNIYYLNDSDSRYYENGNSAQLNGIEGDVMVYFPEFWYKGEDSSTEYIWKFSSTFVNEEWNHAPASLVGAFYGSIGNDDTAYSIIGDRMATSYLPGTIRSAINRKGQGFHPIDYLQHCTIAWMFCARYKTTDFQSTIGKPNVTNETTGYSIDLGIKDTSVYQSNQYKATNFLGLENIASLSELLTGGHLERNTIILYDKGDYYKSGGNVPDSSRQREIYITPGIAGYVKSVVSGKNMDLIAEYTEDSGSGAYSYFTDYQYIRGIDYTLVRCGANNSDNYLGVFNIASSTEQNSSGSSQQSGTGFRLAFDGEINVVSN